MSLGGYNSSQLEAEALDRLGANGALIVAAAGNEANDNDNTGFYPASYKLRSNNIIAGRLHHVLACTQ